MKKSLVLLCVLLNILSVQAQLSVFSDTYASGVSFVGFGGSTNNVTVDNTVNHSGSASLKAIVTTGYTGGALANITAQNLTGYNCLTFWVKASKSATLNVAGLGNDGTNKVFQTEYANVAVTTVWTKIIIPIPNAAKLTAEAGLFHFAESSDEGVYTLWFDDIQFETLSAAVIGSPTVGIATETISRLIGETLSPSGITCSFPVNGVTQNLSISKSFLDIFSSNTSVVTVDVANIALAVAIGSSNVTAKLGAVNASGILTVNVTGSGGVPLIAAPPPPVRSAGDVISLFSGAYSDISGIDWFPSWSQSTVVTEVNIVGNPTKKYSTFNYQGVQFTGVVNASAMTTLHLDVWTPNCTALDVYLINTSPATVEQKVTLTPALSGWNSFDILINQYNTIALNNIAQLKLVGTPFGSSTVYLDNIYFYRAIGTPPTVSITSPLPNAQYLVGSDVV
ncbi:MAG: hypothetical protein ACOYKE_14850, partial [Ferruginibacter sp.]